MWPSAPLQQSGLLDAYRDALAARNVPGANYDLWMLNVDSEYQEQGVALTERQIAEMELTSPLSAGNRVDVAAKRFCPLLQSPHAERNLRNIRYY